MSNDSLNHQEFFHHDNALQTLIIELYESKKLTLSSGRYKIDMQEFTLYIECNRLEDVIRHKQPLVIISVSLHSWIGRWNSMTTVSHTRIDKTTLFTFLKML